MTTDVFTDAERSAVMRKVRSRDTGPELKVRRLLTELGLGYRLHRRDLPSSPDVAFIGRRVALFVHGCFWHGHDCARGVRAPKTRAEYWSAKIARTRVRDARNVAALAALGWRSVIVWECELRDQAAVRTRLGAEIGERKLPVTSDYEAGPAGQLVKTRSRCPQLPHQTEPREPC